MIPELEGNVESRKDFFNIAVNRGLYDGITVTEGEIIARIGDHYQRKVLD